jgi:monovalent cation:H+ antiporter-2, CPA2 family
VAAPSTRLKRVETKSMGHLPQILLLLATAVIVVGAFQRVHVPTSLGYLLVGVILGPHTIGPNVWGVEFEIFAQFGIVFLLFTIGLNFSLPQLQAMRSQVLGLGTGQVVFTTMLVGLAVWLAGLPAPVAFVFGAVFAQSSTTIIASLLNEQGEENSQHGRLGLAMSVFQDVTAVPFLVIIPVLAVSLAADVLVGTLGWALAKAVFAIVLVFVAGRWLLTPLFHIVSERRSGEMFTLAVLRAVGVDARVAWRTGLMLSVGGGVRARAHGNRDRCHGDRHAVGSDCDNLGTALDDRRRGPDSVQRHHRELAGQNSVR